MMMIVDGVEVEVGDMYRLEINGTKVVGDYFVVEPKLYSQVTWITGDQLNSLLKHFPKRFTRRKESLYKNSKTTFNVGDIVDWKTKYGDVVSGKVLKVYETTFGSKVKDTALQLELDTKRHGRIITSVRAKYCTKTKVKV